GLRCDLVESGHRCDNIGSTDDIVLDITRFNIYTLCNAGYTLNFIDNHNDHLDTLTGSGCGFLLGGSNPYVRFSAPERSSGTPICGRWIITLRARNESGKLISTARYETTVRCRR